MTAQSEPARDTHRLSASLRLVLRRYAAQLRRRPLLAASALLLPGLGNLLIFYGPPLVVARLLGSVSADEPLTLARVWPSVAVMAALWLSGEVVWRVAGFAIARIEVRSMEALYVEALDELLAKDVGFFHDNFAGSLTKRALGYARRFEDVFDVLSFSVTAHLLALTVVGVVLWSYSPLLVLTLLGMLASTLAIVLPRIRRRQQLVHAREAASNVLAGHLADSIANAEAVRAFARERDEADVHARNVFDYGAKTLRTWDYQNLHIDTIVGPAYVVTNTLGLLVALTMHGETGASLEAVFVTFSYFAASTRVMWEFNRIYRNLEGALTDAAQFAELLLEPPVVVDASAPDTFAPRDYGLELSQVGFAYAPTLPRLFDDLTLSIPAGTKVGFVGRSGGGKTTLTRLLLRFSDPDAGEIRIGGQPIDRVPLKALRRAIAYVPQDPSMFHRSIADNIRFGRPDATDAEVQRAARLAHAAEFIEALPEGYGTLVGERGVKLSGGQRQRLCLARALLSQAQVLVLDEATSSLDPEGEREVQAALDQLLAQPGRTAVVIAHRLRTIAKADRIVVLEQGRVLEQGTHAELLERRGRYHALWEAQSLAGAA